MLTCRGVTHSDQNQVSWKFNFLETKCIIVEFDISYLIRNTMILIMHFPLLYN